MDDIEYQRAIIAMIAPKKLEQVAQILDEIAALHNEARSVLAALQEEIDEQMRRVG
jgi:hypothetical protein